MSHNVTLDGVQFADLAVLEAAAKELFAEGVQGHFVNGPTQVRGWAGRMTAVEAAIMCPSEQYDVGFVRDKTGALVPLMEHNFCPRGLATEGVAKSVSGDVSSANHWNKPEAEWLGKLKQRYAVRQAESNARKMGASTRRITDAASGQIHLEVVQRS